MTSSGLFLRHQDDKRVVAVLLTALFSIVLMKFGYSARWGRLPLRSPYQPPAFVFVIAWLLIYSFFIVVWIYTVRLIRRNANSPNLPPHRDIEYYVSMFDMLFALNLTLQVLWILMFHVARFYLLSLVIIAAIFALIIVTIVMIARSKFIADDRQAPPIAFFVVFALWIAFAAFLNLTAEDTCACGRPSRMEQLAAWWNSMGCGGETAGKCVPDSLTLNTVASPSPRARRRRSASLR